MNEELVRQKVKEIFDRENHKGIIKDLRKLYNETNDDYVLFKLAKLELDSGKIEAAKTDFRALRRITGYYACSNYYLALLFSRQSEYAKSIQHIEKILDTDSEYYSTMAKQLYVRVAYKNRNYHESIKMYNELKQSNLLTEEVYYYATKSFVAINDIESAIKPLGKAIALDPSNRKYFKYVEECGRKVKERDYGKFIDFLTNLLRLDITYKNEIKTMLPQFRIKTKKSFGIIKEVEENEKNGITSNKHKELYLYLLTGIGDYEKALEVFNENDFINQDLNQNIDLIKLYNKECEYDKAHEICDRIQSLGCNESKEMYYRAYTFIQQGKYEEARILLFKLMNLNYVGIYKNIYAGLIVLSYYLEGDLDNAFKYMDYLSKPDGSKVDTFIRYKLGDSTKNIKFGKDMYFQNLKKYDFQSVYERNRDMLSPYNVRGINKGVNVGNLFNELNEITSDMEPSYRLYKDSYLIDYGEPIGFVLDKETPYLIVDKIPQSGLYKVRPVIPTPGAEDNFQRIR